MNIKGVRMLFKGMAKKAGLPPGTMTQVSEDPAIPTSISIVEYDQDHFEQMESADESLVMKEKASPRVTWFKVKGLGHMEAISRLGEIFNLHPLVMEDVANTYQRPKVEEYDDYVFMVMHAMRFDRENSRLESEQVSLVLGNHWVISFQEGRHELFSSVLERIQRGRGRIRKLGVDYLTYVLMDAMVDQYFVALEAMGEEVEALEEELLQKPSETTMHHLHRLKRQCLAFRKVVWPLREVVSWLSRDETGLVRSEVQPFLRDLYDHTIQVIDQVETLRDLLSGLMDLYLSAVSNRMNEVMKVLTIMATMFIPLTFLAGLYGMNFKAMPELEWKWGYPLVLVVMLVSVVGMLYFFRRKKWI
jgi:magnesium transporter